VTLRRLAFWGAGALLVAVILALLIWPETAGVLTMALLLLVAPLGAIEISKCLKNVWGICKLLSNKVVIIFIN
jgi:hypothetical protein